MNLDAIDRARLAEVMGIELEDGCHGEGKGRYCVMEAVAYVAREPWSDAPGCTCPVIAEFLRAWNDSLADADRTRLLRDLIPLLVGTRATSEIERRRSLVAGDWLVRTHAATWLRCINQASVAEQLASLPEIVDFAQLPDIHVALSTASQASEIALTVARDDVSDAKKALVLKGPWDDRRARTWEKLQELAWDTLTEPAGAAADVAAEDSAWTIATETTRRAIRAAVWQAVEYGAWRDLLIARSNLQQSALELIHRMINLSTPAAGGAPR